MELYIKAGFDVLTSGELGWVHDGDSVSFLLRLRFSVNVGIEVFSEQFSSLFSKIDFSILTLTDASSYYLSGTDDLNKLVFKSFQGVILKAFENFMETPN